MDKQAIEDALTIIEQNIKAVKKSISELNEESEEISFLVARVQAKGIIMEGQHLHRLITEYQEGATNSNDTRKV